MAGRTQFCISLENTIGMFAKLCASLKSAEVSIEAVFVSYDDDCCWVNMVVTPEDAVHNLLREEGYNFFSEKVLVLKTDNRAATLENVATRMAEGGININYVYGGAGEGSSFTLVVNVSDLESARKLLAT